MLTHSLLLVAQCRWLAGLQLVRRWSVALTVWRHLSEAVLAFAWRWKAQLKGYQKHLHFFAVVGLAQLQKYLLVLVALVVMILLMDQLIVAVLSLSARSLNRLLGVLMDLLVLALLASWGLLMGLQETPMKDLSKLAVMYLNLPLSMGSLQDRC